MNPLRPQRILTICLIAAASAANTAAAAGASAEKANRILVDKSERTLVLFSEGRPIRSYPIAFRSPLQPGARRAALGNAG